MLPTRTIAQTTPRAPIQLTNRPVQTPKSERTSCSADRNEQGRQFTFPYEGHRTDAQAIELRDPRAKTFDPANVVNSSFIQELGKSGFIGAVWKKLPCLPTAPPVGRSLFRALDRLRFVSHLEAAQDRQFLCSALLPLVVLRSKLA